MFLTLLFPYFLGNFYRPFLAVVAGELSRDVGLDSAGLASLQATFLLAFAFTQVPVALTLDRFGPRRILILSLAAAVAGGVLLSVSTQPWHALTAMALLGAGFSPVMMAGFYVIGRVYPSHRFATLSSLLFGLGTLGDPVSGAPLTLAVSLFGWRPTIFGMACITVVSLLLIVIVLRDPPRVTAPGGKVSPLAATREIVAIRALWPIAPLMFVSYAVVAAVRGLWIAPYLAQVHHFGPYSVGLAATAMGLALALGGIFYAPINRYLGDAKVTVVSGAAVTVVAWLALGLFGVYSGTFALVLLFVVAGFGASFAILLAHARAFLPTHVLGQGVTMMNLLFFGGAGLGQWLSGRYVKASEIASVAPDLIYGRLFTAFGVVLAVALGIYLLSPRERAASPGPQ
ncbi:MFS transporter [Pseudolabrys sp. FHR47]|uniref:MFS transporter n=1 Tax=Pseudolabrys sp. FHR47 TaxID=2562284 RepID=UPI0010BF4C35|nr:MFS transporter [Pseudolabrys sp. FHR47]